MRTFLTVCFVLLMGSITALAQPVPAMAPVATTPAPAAMPAPAVMAPIVVAPVVAPVAPEAAMEVAPAVVPEPVMSIAPVAAAVPEAMTPVAAPPTVTVAAAEPIYKSAAFWIGVVGSPVLSIIFGVLVAFKVIGQKQFDFLRRHKIVEIADKVVSSFEKFAEGTAPKWDDVVAQTLRAVIDRVGALEGTEVTLVKAVVAERKAQAEVKDNSAVPTEKVVEKVVEKKPEA